MKTQKQVILSHLKRRPATNLELAVKYWIGCPHKRVRELQNDGYKILREKAESNGKRFVRYHLVNA